VWAEPSTIPPREWLYGKHLIRKFATATVAPGGVGKSSLELIEALSIVTGRDLLGKGMVPERGRVWWWNGKTL
jgi:RecA-family ATPase